MTTSQMFHRIEEIIAGQKWQDRSLHEAAVLLSNLPRDSIAMSIQNNTIVHAIANADRLIRDLGETSHGWQTRAIEALTEGQREIFYTLINDGASLFDAYDAARRLE